MAMDLTLYFWQPGHFEYPNGHVGLRVRAARDVVINYDDTEDLDPSYRMALTERGRLKAQKRTEVQQQTLILTAAEEVTIPLQCHETHWGLPLRDGSEYERLRLRTFGLSSVFGGADILHYAGAGIYCEPGVDYRSLDLQTVIAWAKAVLRRVNDLNRKAQELEVAIDRNSKARNYRLQLGGFGMLSESQWMHLSNKDAGNSLIRSEGVMKMDRLVARYHRERDGRKRRTILADLVDAIHEYNRTRGVGSSRQISVLELAKHISIFMEQGGPGDYSGEEF